MNLLWSFYTNLYVEYSIWRKCLFGICWLEYNRKSPFFSPHPILLHLRAHFFTFERGPRIAIRSFHRLFYEKHIIVYSWVVVRNFSGPQRYPKKKRIFYNFKWFSSNPLIILMRIGMKLKATFKFWPHNGLLLQSFRFSISAFTQHISTFPVLFTHKNPTRFCFVCILHSGITLPTMCRVYVC